MVFFFTVTRQLFVFAPIPCRMRGRTYRGGGKARPVRPPPRNMTFPRSTLWLPRFPALATPPPRAGGRRAAPGYGKPGALSRSSPCSSRPRAQTRGSISRCRATRSSRTARTISTGSLPAPSTGPLRPARPFLPEDFWVKLSDAGLEIQYSKTPNNHTI